MSDQSRELDGLSAFSRRSLLKAAGAAGIGLVVAGCSSGSSKAGASQAVPVPVPLSTTPKTPFNPNVPAGLKPNLPRRIGYPLPSNGQLFTTLSDSISQAAKANGIEYISAQANGDSATQFKQTQQMISRGVGSLIIVDGAPPTLQSLQLQAIKSGAAVIAGVYAVSTSQLTADQYKLGHDMGTDAVTFIQTSLGGNAEVALFNLDNAPALKPRTQGTLDALKAGGPGIKIVSNLTETAVSSDFGLASARTILQKNPNTNVWIGSDSVLEGVLAALESAGKAGGNVGLFGTDGDPQALAAIAKGGPYKSSRAFPFAVIGYAWGQYAADWMNGLSIPLVLSLGTVKLDSAAAIQAFNDAASAAAANFKANKTSNAFFTPLGNTSYEKNFYLTGLA